MRYILIFFLFFSWSATSNAQSGIEWMSIEEAEALVKTADNPKKIFIDVYTDWCGWCKKMDQVTFNNPEVSDYMNANFYMVKFNAESKDDVFVKGTTFSFVPSGRRGYHELAVALTQGKLSYPTVVFLDPELNMITPLPGFRTAQPFLQVAKFIGDNVYQHTSWEDYIKSD
jgi:thioredoxin-related protein